MELKRSSKSGILNLFFLRPPPWSNHCSLSGRGQAHFASLAHMTLCAVGGAWLWGALGPHSSEQQHHGSLSHSPTALPERWPLTFGLTSALLGPRWLLPMLGRAGWTPQGLWIPVKNHCSKLSTLLSCKIWIIPYCV